MAPSATAGSVVSGPPPGSETRHALRVAVASVVCLVLAEWWHLQHGFLALMTVYMVMAQYTFTSFQKGVERVVGRGLGIGLGLVLLTVFRNAPLAANALKLLALLAFFYIHFSGRLAYTFLNAGLYLASIVEIGHADPAAAVPQGEEMFLAILLGVLVADLVTWLSGAERDLHLHSGGQPLLPLRGDWLGHALMLVVTVELTQTVARWLDLPTGAALVSVMMLTVTPDLQALLRKGELRLIGLVLGAGWGLGSFLLLCRVPHVPLLAALLFLGMFLAASITRRVPRYSYAGLQMGLVLPAVLVVPPYEFGSLGYTVHRLQGILVSLVASVLVGGLWTRFPTRAEPRPAPTHAR